MRQWPIQRPKILPAPIEAPEDVGARHVVSTLLDARSDALQGKPDRRQPEEDHFNPIAGPPPLSKKSEVGPPAQRALESEIPPGGRQSRKLGQQQSPRVPRR
jgi:hypothetical protein